MSGKTNVVIQDVKEILHPKSETLNAVSRELLNEGPIFSIHP